MNGYQMLDIELMHRTDLKRQLACIGLTLNADNKFIFTNNSWQLKMEFYRQNFSFFQQAMIWPGMVNLLYTLYAELLRQ